MHPPLQNPKYASDVNMPTQTKWRNVGWKTSTFFSTFTNVFFKFLSRFFTFFNVFLFFFSGTFFYIYIYHHHHWRLCSHSEFECDLFDHSSRFFIFCGSSSIVGQQESRSSCWTYMYVRRLPCPRRILPVLSSHRTRCLTGWSSHV